MVAFALYVLCVAAWLNDNSVKASNEEVIGWKNDWDFLSSASHIECDFKKYDKNTVSFDMRQPFVASGKISNWQANQKWKKAAFLQSYGQKTIRIGSESSIVYAGGNAGLRVSIEELIEQMSQNHTSKGDTPFVFDTTVLATIPGMKFDFSVPSIFSSWDHAENERTHQVWHMLSLGPSRSGLPAHNHGQTWLGLVHGMKRWFIYPPGYGPPPEVEEQFNPLLSVTDWLEDIYPKLSNYPKPPLDGEELNPNISGHRPLECIQMPGDVFYLPPKWTHTTLNIGESIALGGQEKSFDNIASSLAMLAKFPRNYELNKDMGLGQMNRAELLNQRFSEAFGHSESGHCLMLSDIGKFYQHLADSKDTWVVLYYHHGMYKDRNDAGESMSLREQFLVMDLLSKRLHGKANVLLMDMTHVSPGDLDFENIPLSVDATTGAAFYALPLIKVHRGARKTMSLSTPFKVDKSGIIYEGDLTDLEALHTFITNGYRIDNLSDGSVLSLTNNALHYYQSGVQYLIKSLKAKPFHPETHIAVCTALSHMMLRAPLHQCITNAASLFESFDVPGVSKIALSTVFQRLGHIYMNKSLYSEALPLIKRSLSYNAKYTVALVDKIVIHIELKDKASAVESLAALKAIKDDRASREIPRLSNAVANMN